MLAGCWLDTGEKKGYWFDLLRDADIGSGWILAWILDTATLSSGYSGPGAGGRVFRGIQGVQGASHRQGIQVYLGIQSDTPHWYPGMYSGGSPALRLCAGVGFKNVEGFGGICFQKVNFLVNTQCTKNRVVLDQSFE